MATERAWTAGVDRGARPAHDPAPKCPEPEKPHGPRPLQRSRRPARRRPRDPEAADQPAPGAVQQTPRPARLLRPGAVDPLPGDAPHAAAPQARPPGTHDA